MTFPSQIAASDTKTATALSLLFGPGDTEGTTHLQYLYLSLTGGATAVSVTITGLMAELTNTTNTGEIVFSIGPGQVASMPFPGNGLLGSSQLTLAATPGSGQTLSALMVGEFI